MWIARMDLIKIIEDSVKVELDKQSQYFEAEFKNAKEDYREIKNKLNNRVDISASILSAMGNSTNNWMAGSRLEVKLDNKILSTPISDTISCSSLYVECIQKDNHGYNITISCDRADTADMHFKVCKDNIYPIFKKEKVES